MLEKFFVPFMLGSISLIAFLSIRNTYLAGRTRDLCTLLLESKKQVWQTSYSLQLFYFVRRYKINNLALRSAIISVLCFGIMIANEATPLTNWIKGFGSAPSVLVHTGSAPPSVLALIAGGVLATIATLVSIYETSIGRRSLFTHVACTIINTRFHDPNEILCNNLKNIEKSIRRPFKKKENDDLRQKLGCVREAQLKHEQAVLVQGIKRDIATMNEQYLFLG